MMKRCRNLSVVPDLTLVCKEVEFSKKKPHCCMGRELHPAQHAADWRGTRALEVSLKRKPLQPGEYGQDT
jgi:hypothetical protein